MRKFLSILFAIFLFTILSSNSVYAETRDCNQPFLDDYEGPINAYCKSPTTSSYDFYYEWGGATDRRFNPARNTYECRNYVAQQSLKTASGPYSTNMIKTPSTFSSSDMYSLFGTPSGLGCDLGGVVPQGSGGLPGNQMPSECVQYGNTSCGLIPCSCRGFYSYKGCNPCTQQGTCSVYGVDQAGYCSGNTSYCGLCNNYAHQCCYAVPSGCKTQLGCPNEEPTPTPGPNCTLQCPGTQVPGSGINGGAGIVQAPSEGDVAGVSSDSTSNANSNSKNSDSTSNASLLAQALDGGLVSNDGKGESSFYTAYGEAAGNLIFTGYNYFKCFYFNNGLTEKDCPAAYALTGGSGKDTGLTNDGAALGATTIQPSTLDLIIHEQNRYILFIKPVLRILEVITGEQTLLDTERITQTLFNSNQAFAQSFDIPNASDFGTFNGTSDSSNAEQTTWQDPVRYHTLNGNQSKQYTAFVSNSTGQYCACATLLQCEASLQDSPNDASMESGQCDANCNFTVNPERPYYDSGTSSITQVTFDMTAGNGYDVETNLDVDDGNQYPGGGPTQSIVHQYVNSGVYNVSLTCTNATANSQTCTRKVNVYCSDPSAFPTPSPTPTPTPGPWVKMQNTSSHSPSNIYNVIPDEAGWYSRLGGGDDTDDKGVSCTLSQGQGAKACYISGEDGFVSVSGTTADFGNNPPRRNWVMTDSTFSLSRTLTPNTFFDYVAARKESVDITNESGQVDWTAVTPGAINVFTGSSFTIDDTTVGYLDAITEATAFLISSDLDINVTAGEFNVDGTPLAFIVDGEIGIDESMTELRGIYIANTIDYAANATGVSGTPLKIRGNVVSIEDSTACNVKRARTDDLTKPTCFFVQDFASQYFELLELLSTRTYEWNELAN